MSRLKEEIVNKLLSSNKVKEYDFIDLSFSNARLNEIDNGIVRLQMSNGLCPCIKTNINNYFVVVKDNRKDKMEE